MQMRLPRGKLPLYLVIAVLVVAVCVLAVYLLAVKHELSMAQFRLSLLEQSAVPFYARCEDKFDTSILIEGSPVNSINYRGKFFISIVDGAYNTTLILDKDGKKVTHEQITAHSSLRVTFNGAVYESNPATFSGDCLIEILE